MCAHEWQMWIDSGVYCTALCNVSFSTVLPSRTLLFRRVCGLFVGCVHVHVNISGQNVFTDMSLLYEVCRLTTVWCEREIIRESDLSRRKRRPFFCPDSAGSLAAYCTVLAYVHV